MKKLILTLVIALASISFLPAQTEESETLYVTDSNVEKLVDKYSSKIEATIVSLAESLKQPAEYVYIIMIKQQYVKATVWLTVWAIFIVFTFLLAGAFKKSKWEDDNRSNNKDEIYNKYATATIIYSIVAIVTFFMGMMHMDVILQGFINPEYGAIQDIIKLFKD